MQRKFSLRKPADFQRVRSSGVCQQHALVAIYASRTPDGIRVGYTVGRRFGSAVQRNRVRRRLREVVRCLLPRLARGWDLVIVARKGSETTAYAQLAGAVERCLLRSGVLSLGAGADTRGHRSGVALPKDQPDAP